MQITEHTSIDVFRANQKEALHFSMEADADKITAHMVDVLENSIPKADRETLRSALACIDDQSRRLIGMRYGEGLSIKEIARTLDIKEGTISSRLCRTLKKLRVVYAEIEQQEAY